MDEIINCPCCHRLVYASSHKPISKKFCTVCEQYVEEDTVLVKHEIWQAQFCSACYAETFPNGEKDYQKVFDDLSR